jgi:hypothetical protein
MIGCRLVHVPDSLCRFVVNSRGCWVWTGNVNSAGYGTVRIHGKTLFVHRVMFRLLGGHIPAGWTIDHLCRNKLCINPRHLEACTQRVNVLRGKGACAKNARKTRCLRGHEFTDENTRRDSNGWRQCARCRRLRDRRRRHHIKREALTCAA